MVSELLVLALDYHRFPLRYKHLSDLANPLPKGFDKLLTDFCLSLTPQQIVRNAESLQTDPPELWEAAFFFLRQVLFAPGADHYRVLGLSRSASNETLRRHYSLLVRIFHPDRSFGDKERNAEFTARLNVAYETLRRSDSRRRYDEEIRSVVGESDVDANDFFWPRNATPLDMESPAESVPDFSGRRRTVFWMTVGFVVFVLISFAFKSINTPLLRVNPELAKGVPDGPSFLQGSYKMKSGAGTENGVSADPGALAHSPVVRVPKQNLGPPESESAAGERD